MAKKSSISGRPRTISAIVSHPTVPLETEKVQRVFDPIEMLRARRQLADDKDNSELAYMAAQKIRVAWDTIHGSCGSTMDFDKVRSGWSAGRGIAQCYLNAAAVLNAVRQNLYSHYFKVIELIVCEGRSLAETAEIILRIKPKRADIKLIGDTLRHGLAVAASIFFGSVAQESGKIRSYREAVEYVSSPAGNRTIIVGTAHAAGRSRRN